MSSYTRCQLESWLGKIKVPAGSKVLDIGGSQNPIQGRLGNKGENTEYKILDLEVPHECKKKPDYICDIQDEVEVSDATPSTTVKYKDGSETTHNESFDVVFCIEVSEYWYNPLEAVENIKDLLMNGGILYISFHFIYPQHNPMEEDCLRYTKTGCIKLLEKTGFKIEEITPREAEEMSPMELFRAERMRPAQSGRHNEIGYLIKAKKL